MSDQAMRDAIAHLVSSLNNLSEETRRQLKLDLIIEILQGETSNSGAGIIISVIAQFAVTVSTQQGFDPNMILANISKDARRVTKEKLAEAGLTASIPAGAKAVN